jgi:hypothetical protein
MSDVLPIVLWYGGLVGLAAAALLVLWALALYAIKQATGSFAAGILLGGLVLAVASSAAVTHATRLNQENQLRKVHEPLIRLVAASAYSRGALQDLRAIAEPSPALTALQSNYDAHGTSIENLLESEWQYHRAGPWDEPVLLHKMTWDVGDLLVHHARWERRAEALECPAGAALPALEDVTARLRDRLQMERTLAMAIGEQFEGYDLQEQRPEPLSDAAVMKTLATVCGVLALASVVSIVFASRKRSWQIADGLVAVAVLVLGGLAGWLVLGAGAAQERRRADLFDRTATVYRETLGLNDDLEALMLLPRGGVLQHADTAGTLIADYAEYMNSVQGLAQLVRIWDRAVLTGILDTGLVSSQRIQTHDDLLNAMRSRTLTLYRQYVELDRRIVDMSCRSEWFPRVGSRTREDELLTLPTSP